MYTSRIFEEKQTPGAYKGYSDPQNKLALVILYTKDNNSPCTPGSVAGCRSLVEEEEALLALRPLLPLLPLPRPLPEPLPPGELILD